MKRNDIFASVVGIGNTDTVCRAKSFLCGKTASRKDRAEIALGNGNGKTRADLYSLACTDDNLVFKASIKIIARRAVGAACGNGSVFIEFFDLNLHKLLLLVTAEFGKLETFVLFKRPTDIPFACEDEKILSAEVLYPFGVGGDIER